MLGPFRRYMRFDWDTFMLACPHPNAKPLFAQPRRWLPLNASSTISRVDGLTNLEPVGSRPSIKDVSQLLTSVLRRGAPDRKITKFQK